MDFEIRVSRKDWRLIVNRSKNSKGEYVYEATSAYASVLTLYFNAVNPICVLSGRKKIFGYTKKNPDSGSYYIAYCGCKAGSCGIIWTFTVKIRPSKNAETVEVLVR